MMDISTKVKSVEKQGFHKLENVSVPGNAFTGITTYILHGTCILENSQFLELGLTVGINRG